MRTETKIYFDGNDVPGGPQSLLDAAGCGSDVVVIGPSGQTPSQTAVSVTLDATDERLSLLVPLLVNHGVHWSEYRWDHFTERELENAPLLVMWPRGQHQIDGRPKVGAAYKLIYACQTCGAGATLRSPMRIDIDVVPKLKGLRAVLTYGSNILVDEQLALGLEKLDLKGLSFRDVISSPGFSSQKKPTTPAQLPWKRLVAARSLPPFSPASTGVTRQFPCVSCKQSGYIGQNATPPQLAYRAFDLRDIDDVMTTWEWFGKPGLNGNLLESALPYPWFLVSPKVMHAFRKAGITTFDWLPVRIINKMWML